MVAIKGEGYTVYCVKFSEYNEEKTFSLSCLDTSKTLWNIITPSMQRILYLQTHQGMVG